MDDIICLFCKHRQPLSGGCKAYPDEIPFEFSSGEKEHREQQENRNSNTRTKGFNKKKEKSTLKTGFRVLFLRP